MKKISAFIVLSFMVYQGFSQCINYGIGTGLNYSGFAVADNASRSFDYKIGLQLNAIVNYDFSEEVGLRIEPGVINRGTFLDGLDAKLNINYFNIPFLLKYSPIEKFSILFGPEFSYLLTAKSRIERMSINIKPTFDNKIDFGINTGLSYGLTDKLEIGLRYNRGFIIPTENIKVIVNGESKKITNQGFAFTIAYIIN